MASLLNSSHFLSNPFPLPPSSSLLFPSYISRTRRNYRLLAASCFSVTDKTILVATMPVSMLRLFQYNTDGRPRISSVLMCHRWMRKGKEGMPSMSTPTVCFKQVFHFQFSHLSLTSRLPSFLSPTFLCWAPQQQSV